MAVTPRLEIKQSQSLLMTPQLRQAINLLQLNNIELNELIETELNSNPLLEREDDTLNSLKTTEQNNDNSTQSDIDTETFHDDFDTENAYDDYGSDREGYDSSWVDRISNKHSAQDDEYNYLEQKLSSQESAYEIISRQINGEFNSAKERFIASHLMSFLDGAGYFVGDLNKISNDLKTSIEYLQTILQRMQRFEPAGVFATSLKECLKIQLKDINRLDDMISIFLEHLELLAKGDFKSLKKICHADDDDLKSMISDIKSLNPKPLAKFSLIENSYIIPDVFVKRNKYGEYIVELNQDTLPRVLINHEYCLKLSKTKDKSSKKYIKDKLSSANFLIKSLHQRATTILQISEEIIKQQRDFFEYGIHHLRPMLLRDIAEAVEMHESTVSRVTSHKYIHTPNGLFELKYFFSTAAGTFNGNTQTSTTSIKHKLKQLIENEGANILSDDALTECLAAQSIKIARRTVAKYREELGIPSSSQRKRALHKINI